MPQTQEAGIREYELIYVLRPNVDNAEAERVNGRIGEIVESFGGKLTKLDNWGRRRLAYSMQKNSRGLFVYARYVGTAGVVAEVERALRISDSVLRHQTVLLRRDVDASLLQIDPEELKFAPVEEAEPEEDVALEQRLGLVSSSSSRSGRSSSEGDYDDDSDSKSESKSESESKSDAESDAESKSDSDSGSEPSANAEKGASA